MEKEYQGDIDLINYDLETPKEPKRTNKSNYDKCPLEKLTGDIEYGN